MLLDVEHVTVLPVQEVCFNGLTCITDPASVTVALA